MMSKGCDVEMTIEERLKEMILTQYKSLQKFADHSGINYQTLVAILKRGVNKASIHNIIDMCHTLEISVDELADGRIVPVNEDRYHKALTDLDTIIAEKKHCYNEYTHLTIDNIPISQSEFETLLELLQLGVNLIRRTREK